MTKNKIPFKTMKNFIALLICFWIFVKHCKAGDTENLYDICPTDFTNKKIFINGLFCKNPSNTTASDFKSSLLTEGGDTENFYRSSMIIATATEYAGLNTLGLSAARVDIEVDGMVEPHAHPRASEMVFVSSGVVVAGFLDMNNKVFQKVLKDGDVFVFPKGLLHFCYNAGFDHATIFSVLNSQNPGLVSISGAMFLSSNYVSKVKDVMILMRNSTSLEDFDLDGIDIMNLFGNLDTKDDQV